MKFRNNTRSSSTGANDDDVVNGRAATNAAGLVAGVVGGGFGVAGTAVLGESAEATAFAGVGALCRSAGIAAYNHFSGGGQVVSEE